MNHLSGRPLVPLLAICLLLSLWPATRPSWADDWPTYKKDAHRSSVSDEELTLPLKKSWVYRSAQMPKPAWPEPQKNLNRLDFDYAPHPVIGEGIVCFGSSADDTVRALDSATGGERWHFTTGGPVRFAPQICQGKVYFVSDDGHVYCVEAESGKPIWTFRPELPDERFLGNGRMISRWPIRSGILVDRGEVYFAAGMWAAEGIFVYALDAQNGKVVWVNDTSGAEYVRIVGHLHETSLSGVNPQGALLATEDKLIFPMGRAAPASYDRKTGKLLQYHPGATNGSGGSWATLDGPYCYVYSKSFYSNLAVLPLFIDTLERDDERLRAGVPQASHFHRAWQYSTYEGKVSVLVKDGKVTSRAAYGLAQAGKTLLIGDENLVYAEDAANVVHSAKRSQQMAAIRFGIAGTDLAVHAEVADRKITQHETVWKGSCIEIFGSVPGTKTIGQVFLVPAVGELPEKAFLASNGKQVPTSEIRLTTQQSPDGYVMNALIPLELLSLDSAKNPVSLEVQVTAAAASGNLIRNTLFGSSLAYMDNSSYGQFRISAKASADKNVLLKLKPLGGAGETGKALASATIHTIRSNVLDRLWQAEVNGRVREIAVSDGRVFVSTELGEISCFAPANDAKPAGATLHDPAASFRKEISAPEPADAALIQRIAAAGMDAGYALVVGDADGRLSRVLAERTRLHIIHVTTDSSAASALREELLSNTLLYGSKLHIQEVESLERLPFPQYLFNAILVAGEANGLSIRELYRVLRPAGGILLTRLDAEKARALLTGADLPAGEIRESANIPFIVRERLEGVWDWDGERGGDKQVKWPLRPTWFGGPGPAKFYNRKYRGQTLAAANGRFFVSGDSNVFAIDAYNGQELWSRPVPFQPVGGGTLNADADQVYYTLGKDSFHGKGAGCFVLDASTGEQKKVYAPYVSPAKISLNKKNEWELFFQGQIASGKDTAGSLGLEKTADGLRFLLTSPDTASSKETEWGLYLDFRPGEERFGLYQGPIWHYRIFPGNDNTHASWKPGTGKNHPKLVLKNIKSEKGLQVEIRLAWKDIRGTAQAATFDFAASISVRDLTSLTPDQAAYLFCNASANGLNNGWAKVVPDGSPEMAIDLNKDEGLLGDGLVGAKKEDAAPPPSIVAGQIETGDKEIDAEAFDALPRDKWQAKHQVMDNGDARRPRIHPLTGERVEKYWTVGDGCSGLTFSSTSMFNRSGNIAIYDFADDSGMRVFPGMRPSCGTSTMAAHGMWYVSDGGSGCECTYNFQTSIGFAPAERRLEEDWAVYPGWKVDTLVRQAALNMGAPGDRRDETGKLWLGFPRQADAESYNRLPGSATWAPIYGVWQQRQPVALPVPLDVELDEGLGTHRVNADRVRISKTDQPWLYASQYVGIRKAKLKLDFIKPLAARASETPVAIDGRLDDAPWKAEPQAVLSTLKAKIFFAFDSKYIYIAGTRPLPLPDRLGEVRKWTPLKETRRDDPIYHGDAWEVFLSDFKNENILHIGIGSSGGRLDALAEGKDKNENLNWNGAWESAFVADENEFAVEFAIPWTEVARSGIDKDNLSINVQVGRHFKVAEAMVRLGARGRSRCANFVPLGLGKAPEVAPRRFTLRLHFAELLEAKAGDRVFNVKIQGKTLLNNFDVFSAAGGAHQAIIQEFQGISAGGELALEFNPAKEGKAALNASPILNALELQEEKD
ncbi:MAG: PQQ-binding-like beta-propeller repeat protein [Planctomycetota bacterium]|nr:PQQ-binding-like beta-propeller repeat protein [Planctomycetota bacterium]